MDEEKFQKELFEFEKPKRFLPRLSDFFPKADFERNVILTLTLDRAVIITIGIIMTMVVIYALGVESGKNRPEAVKNAPIPAATAPVAVKIAPVTYTAPASGLRSPAVVKIAPPAIAAPRTVPAAAPKPAAVVNTAAKPYTIVAVTLTRRDTAAAEVSKLKSRGINAFIVPSDRYFQVCVGAYPDKAGVQVQKDLKKIRRLYKDAYLKLRSTQ